MNWQRLWYLIPFLLILWIADSAHASDPCGTFAQTPITVGQCGWVFARRCTERVAVPGGFRTLNYGQNFVQFPCTGQASVTYSGYNDCTGSPACFTDAQVNQSLVDWYKEMLACDHGC